MLTVGLHVRTVASTVATVVWNEMTCVLVGNTNFSDELVASVFRFLFSITQQTSITFPVPSVSSTRKVEQALGLYIIIIINLSNDRSKASSKTIPPHSAI